MAENSSSAIASVAIVVLVVVALVFAYFVFTQIADDGANIELNIGSNQGVGSVSPDEGYAPMPTSLPSKDAVAA